MTKKEIKSKNQYVDYLIYGHVIYEKESFLFKIPFIRKFSKNYNKIVDKGRKNFMKWIEKNKQERFRR